MKLAICLLCILALSFLFEIEGARGMWGSKKKREEEEKNNRDQDSDFNQFELKQKLAASHVERKSSPSSSTSQTFGQIRQMLDAYITMMEDFLESPHYDVVINPASIQTLFSQIPGLAENPQMSQMADLISSMDASQLKSQMRLGLQAMKAYLDEIESMATDPEKLNLALEQFPAESRPIIEGLMKGDLEPLKSRVMNEPTIDYSMKKLILSVLEGDTAGALEGAKSFLKNNPSSIEMMRTQLLSSPDMAEMMGVSRDLIKDKKKWAAAIEDGLDLLGNMNLGGGGAGNMLGDMSEEDAAALLSQYLESAEIDLDGDSSNDQRKRNKYSSAAA